MSASFFELAAELIARREPFATATVVRADRPTSAKPGAKAIITPDGSGITMVLVALPMLALYVVGYGAAVRVEHARARAKT